MDGSTPGDQGHIWTPEIFGRSRELEALRSALLSNHLVAVTGCQGVGKTRLVHELGRDGTRLAWVDGSLPAPDLESAVARALQPGADDRGRGPPRGGGPESPDTRVVVLDGARCVSHELLAMIGRVVAGNDVRFVVTSRPSAPLQLHRIHLLPLPVPTPEQLEGGPALDLFVAAAERAGRPIGGDVEQLHLAKQIVAACDGIPWPIERAASWLRLLSMTALHHRACGRAPQLPDLAAPYRETLDQLDSDCRDALAKLCVFSGAFTVDDASAVLDLTDVRALALLETLLDEGILVRHESVASGRLSVLKPFRWASADDPCKSDSGVRDRHACRTELQGKDADRDDVRDAIAHVLADPSPSRNDSLARLAEILGRRSAWDSAGTATDLALVDRVIQRVQETVSVARVAHLLESRAMLLAIAGRLEESAATFRSAAVEGARQEDPGLEVRALRGSGMSEYLMTRPDRARISYERALEVAHRHGRTADVGWLSANLASALASLGQLDTAWALLEEVTSLSRRVGDPRLTAQSLASSGSLALERRQLDVAETAFREAAVLARRANALRLAICCEGYAGVACLLDRRFDAAIESLDIAATRGRALRESQLVATFLGYSIVARARAGRVVDATSLISECIAVSSDHVVRAQVAEVHVAAVDVAEASALAALGDRPRAHARIHVAARAIENAKRAGIPGRGSETPDGALLVHYSDELRIALSSVEPWMREIADAIEVSPRASEGRGETLHVGRGGARFRLGDVDRDLSSRPVLARLLWAMAERHLSGRDATPTELIAATWPGELISARSATGRLYVAISEMRKLGLRDAIARAPGGGYRLTTLVSIEY